MIPGETEQQTLAAVLAKNKKLTKADLQRFRENAGGAEWMGKPFSFRMEVEHIDAIRSLDETSSRLAKVGIAVAIVAAALGVLQIVLVVLK
jgi:hypothetical protein